MNRQEAKDHISETCGIGWFNLLDIIYDNAPSSVHITEVFQKYGGLKIRYNGDNHHFEELVDIVYYISQKMCEKCGKSAGLTIIDNWETTLCDEHYDTAIAVEKHKC